MFSLMHLHFASRVLGPLGPAGLLGAIFPDTARAAGLTWEGTHLSTDRLYRTANGLSSGPVRTKMLDFARAALTHGADPPGLDHYGDECYPGGERGYSFQLARPFAEQAATICGLPSEMGWWKAHNFVEMAVELVVKEEAEDLGRRLNTLLANTAATEEAGAFLASALPGVDAGRAAAGFRSMPHYLALEEPDPPTLAARYERQVKARHGVQSIDLPRAAALIEELVPRVERTLPAFLEFAEPRVREMIKRYPG